MEYWKTFQCPRAPSSSSRIMENFINIQIHTKRQPRETKKETFLIAVPFNFDYLKVFSSISSLFFSSSLGDFVYMIFFAILLLPDEINNSRAKSESTCNTEMFCSPSSTWNAKFSVLTETQQKVFSRPRKAALRRPTILNLYCQSHSDDVNRNDGAPRKRRKKKKVPDGENLNCASAFAAYLNDKKESLCTHTVWDFSIFLEIVVFSSSRTRRFSSSCHCSMLLWEPSMMREQQKKKRKCNETLWKKLRKMNVPVSTLALADSSMCRKNYNRSRCLFMRATTAKMSRRNLP